MVSYLGGGIEWHGRTGIANGVQFAFAGQPRALRDQLVSASARNAEGCISHLEDLVNAGHRFVVGMAWHLERAVCVDDGLLPYM